MNRRLCATIAGALTVFVAFAQQDDSDKGIVVTGSVQSDILIPQDDKKIQTEPTSDWGLTNTYADVNLTSRHIDAGIRFEYNQHPLPGGYEADFKGWGVPYFYVRGIKRNV